MAGLAGGLLHLHRRALFGGLFAHPLLVGPVVGWLGGDTSIGMIVGAALALLWERPGRRVDGPDPGGGVAAAIGTTVAITASTRLGLGGLLVESFVGALVCLPWAFVAGVGERQARRFVGRRHGGSVLSLLLRYHALDLGVVAGVIVLGVVLSDFLLGAAYAWDQHAIMRWSPWLSGVLLSAGLGAAIADRHPRDASGRRPSLPLPGGSETAAPPPGALTALVRSFLAEGAGGDPVLARAGAAWAMAAWPTQGVIGGQSDTWPTAHRVVLPSVVAAAGHLLHRGRTDEVTELLARPLVELDRFADGAFWPELRLLVVIGGLVLLNGIGPAGLFALMLAYVCTESLVRLWGFRQGLIHGARGVDELLGLPWLRFALGCRAASLVAAVPVALFVVWLPYQLPSQELCLFPIPGGRTAVVGLFAAWALKMAPFLIGIVGSRWSIWALIPVAWAAEIGLGWALGGR